MTQNQNLIEEIKQITAQFKEEVPGKGKTWPKAIKQRVKVLLHAGLNSKTIADQTGLPYFTVLSWRERSGKPRGRFREVGAVTAATGEQIFNHSTAPVAVNLAAVTVTTPSGYRIEGITFTEVMSIFERLK
jgi:hypothetical protein